ncbi:MAG: ABC-F family ATP-binding cassette domain-containing protein [Candidatus Cloacimonadales bacterium]
MINIGEVLVTFSNVNKKFSDKDIITEASFGIHSGEKMGIIGVNGCGKSTFLKLVMGIEPTDSGEITFRNDMTTAYLPQTPVLDDDLTILEQIYSSDKEEFVLLKEYFHLSDQLTHTQDQELCDRQAELAERIEVINGWSIEAKAKSYLTQLGITDFQQKIGILSGGQRRKIDLASVLLKEPDLLILDEPTNHLDIDSIEWLQQHLTDYQGNIIFVTHDRYFLDSICNKIMDIEQGTIRFYDGNYSYYIEKKEMEDVDRQRKETRMQAQLSKELKWLQRGAKARSTKPKSHVDRVMELLDKSYLIDQQEVDISFQTHRMGKKILELGNITHTYDTEPLINNFSHIFQKFERIGIIGDNGCGKTTLLKIITKDLIPTKGVVNAGINTKFAYFRQEADAMPADKSVFQYISSFAENIRTKDGVLHSATEMLERFLFEPKMQQAKISSLSGGEKKRLHLLKSLMFGANFIILDEPTNDLDIRTLEILEDYLDAFDGCILVVSHDRFFLDRICDFLFIFENDKITKFAGNYSDYLLVKRYRAEIAEDDAKEKFAKVKTVKTGLSFKEKNELADTNQRLEEIEFRLLELSNTIENKADELTHQEFTSISEEQANLDDEMLTLLLRLEELEEI